jgi:hypothetical protein
MIRRCQATLWREAYLLGSIFPKSLFDICSNFVQVEYLFSRRFQGLGHSFLVELYQRISLCVRNRDSYS